MQKWMLLFLLGYVLLALIIVEYENYRLGYDQLQTFHREYENGGSNKWRSASLHKGKDITPNLVTRFPILLYFFGLPVYILSPLGIVLATFYIRRLELIGNKFKVLGSMLLFIGAWALYMYQGVWMASFG